MKRSHINQIIQNGEKFLAEQKFYLPPFATWNPEDWQHKNENAQEIVSHGLGWDVTDFGLGDFNNKGALLFTIRNGPMSELKTGGRVYCEKIIVIEENQTIMHHYHETKTEDIINRGGAMFEIVLHNAGENKKLLDTPVTFSCDGVVRTAQAGEPVLLAPGESITLMPRVYHQFCARGGRLLCGEVSTVNDDATDNYFAEPLGRFPSIEEDEAPYRLLVTEYNKHYKHAKK